MRKLITGLLTLFFLFTPQTVSAALPGEDLDLESEASMVVDLETGRVLHQDQADEVRAIASLTKMMVQYIVLEEINAGNLSWEEEVAISPFLEELSANFILANVPLASSRTYTVRQLFDAVSVYSANAATIALTEHIEGSEENFVHRMRDLVQSFGIEDAHIVNSTGLHNSFMEGNYISDSQEDDENRMSARSVMVIASHLLKDYPEILDISSQPTLAFPTYGPDFIVENWNKMLPGLSHAYPGVKGMKTGTTDAAGRSFAGFVDAERDLITVVLSAGDIDVESDRYLRFTETADLMTAHKDAWQMTPVVSTEDFSETAVVAGGSQESIALDLGESKEVLLPKEGDHFSVSLSYNEDLLNRDSQLKAPLDQGQEVGHLLVSFDESLSYLDGQEVTEIQVPVLAGETVERDGFFNRIWGSITDFFDQVMKRLAF